MAKMTEVIVFVCGSDEKAQLYEMAHAQYMSMSELLRRLIKKEFDAHQSEKLGHPPTPDLGLDDDDDDDDYDDDVVINDDADWDKLR